MVNLPTDKVIDEAAPEQHRQCVRQIQPFNKKRCDRLITEFLIFLQSVLVF
jgi:hypothetical protein